MRGPSTKEKCFASQVDKAHAFLKADEGVTAIEFAVLALPFFAVIGAIMETSVMMLASQVLDSAVQDTSRLIITGQAQAASYDASVFRAKMCDHLYGMFDCAKLKIRVEVLPDFSSASLPPPVDPVTGAWQVVDAFNPGQGRQVVMVRAYYKWPTLLRINGFDLRDSPDGTHLLGAVRIFANEPFPG